MALDPVNTLLAVSAGAILLGGTFYVLFGSPFERRANHTREQKNIASFRLLQPRSLQIIIPACTT